MTNSDETNSVHYRVCVLRLDCHCRTSSVCITNLNGTSSVRRVSVLQLAVLVIVRWRACTGLHVAPLLAQDTELKQDWHSA